MRGKKSYYWMESGKFLGVKTGIEMRREAEKKGIRYFSCV